MGLDYIWGKWPCPLPPPDLLGGSVLSIILKWLMLPSSQWKLVSQDPKVRVTPKDAQNSPMWELCLYNPCSQGHWCNWQESLSFHLYLNNNYIKNGVFSRRTLLRWDHVVKPGSYPVGQCAGTPSLPVNPISKPQFSLEMSQNGQICVGFFFLLKYLISWLIARCSSRCSLCRKCSDITK